MEKEEALQKIRKAWRLVEEANRKAQYHWNLLRPDEGGERWERYQYWEDKLVERDLKRLRLEDRLVSMGFSRFDLNEVYNEEIRKDYGVNSSGVADDHPYPEVPVSVGRVDERPDLAGPQG